MATRGPSRGSNKTAVSLRVKKDRSRDVFTPWDTPAFTDDYGVVKWAKKRQVQDCRPPGVVEKSRSSASMLQWAEYVCTIVKKCRAIENVHSYIDNSLSVSLKPVPSHLEHQPVKVKLKHSLSAMQLPSTNHQQAPVNSKEDKDKKGEELRLSSVSKQQAPAVKGEKGEELQKNRNITEESSSSDIPHSQNSKTVPNNTTTSNTANNRENSAQNANLSHNNNSLVKDNNNGAIDISGSLVKVNGVNKVVRFKSNHDEKSLNHSSQENATSFDAHSDPGMQTDKNWQFGASNDSRTTQDTEVNGPVEEDAEESGVKAQAATKVLEKPTPPRFGYTNRKNSFADKSRTEFVDEEEGSDNGFIADNNTQSETVSVLNALGSKTIHRKLHATTLSNIPLVPAYVQLRTRGSTTLRDRVLTSKSEPDMKDYSLDEDLSSLVGIKTKKEKSGDQVVSGMSVATIRTRHRKVDSLSATTSHQSETIADLTSQKSTTNNTSVISSCDPQQQRMTQKQVMLVLNNVTLKDSSGIEEFLSKNNYPVSTTSSLLPQFVGGGSSGGVSLKSMMSGKSMTRSGTSPREVSGHMRSSCFPIADLLPAVDNSIRNSMPLRHHRSSDLTRDHSSTVAGVEGSDEGGREDDGRILNFNHNTDFFRLREHTLGLPTFRPQNNKTPLHRAKENTKKRLESTGQVNERLSSHSRKSNSTSSKSHHMTSDKSRPDSRSDVNKLDKDSRLAKHKEKRDAYFADSQKAQIQEISRTIASRLNELSRQKTSHDWYDRAPVT